MKVKALIPNNYGWFEVKLDPFAFDHLWKCIDEGRGESLKHGLAGQIEDSFSLTDIDDYFFNKVVLPLCHEYTKRWGMSFTTVPVKDVEQMGYGIKNMWVNYQNQHEYNPIHDHGGLFSFVVWMKIPTSFSEQNKISNAAGSNHGVNSAFCIDYNDIFGGPMNHLYGLNSSYEGMMLFFPSKLRHYVNPYYNCDEQRISISGNIILKPIDDQVHQ